MDDLYERYPWVYHLLYARLFDYAAIAREYDQVLRRVNARRVLDVGCGTGLLARQMVNLGYDFTGVDLHAPMLTIARSYVPEAQFLTGDMRNLPALASEQHLDPFDAVISTGRAFSILTGGEDIVRCLAGAAAFVREGGIFACDVFNAGVIFKPFVTEVTSEQPIEGGFVTRHFTKRPLLTAGFNFETVVRYTVQRVGEATVSFCHAQESRAYIAAELNLFFAQVGFAQPLPASAPACMPGSLLTAAIKTAGGVA